MSNSKNIDTKKLAILGILTSIIILQNFIPFLGYIPFQPFNPTIIHITVIIASVILGTKEGSILGFVWGIMCVIRAYTAPTTPMDTIIFTNPFVAVFPRILVGLFSGLCYSAFKKLNIKPLISFVICGIIGSFTNTIFVLGMIYLLFKDTYAGAIGVVTSEVLPALMGIVGSFGVVEAIVAGILVPAVSLPLMTIYKNRS